MPNLELICPNPATCLCYTVLVFTSVLSYDKRHVPRFCQAKIWLKRLTKARKRVFCAITKPVTTLCVGF